MGWKLEEKEETILHNVLNLTPPRGLNVLLHTCKFFHKLTDIMQLIMPISLSNPKFPHPHSQTTSDLVSHK